MKHFRLCIMMVLVLLLMGMTPVFASEAEDAGNTGPDNHEIITIPVHAEGNYFMEWTSEDGSVTRIEITDPTSDAPMQDMSCEPYILGDEEFAPGKHTRTLQYKKTYKKGTPNEVTLQLKWSAYFTIYSDSTKPKITSVSTLIHKNFATYTPTKIAQASATSTKPAFAFAGGRDLIIKPDGKCTTVDMQFYLYHDDSAKVIIDVTRASN